MPFDELTREQWEQLKAYDNSQCIYPFIEIDSVMDDFDLLYRVWYEGVLQGTFYRVGVDGSGVLQSSNTDVKHYCNTSSEAQLLILAINGLLVVDLAA